MDRQGSQEEAVSLSQQKGDTGRLIGETPRMERARCPKEASTWYPGV